MKVFAAFQSLAFLRTLTTTPTPTSTTKTSTFTSTTPSTLLYHRSTKNNNHIMVTQNESDNCTLSDSLSTPPMTTATTTTTNDTPTQANADPTGSTNSSTSTSNVTMSHGRLSEILPPLIPGSRRVYLLRHGETDWNKLGKIQGGGFDIPLNENGRSQAHAMAKAMEDIPITVIASSPLSRAKETATIVWNTHAHISNNTNNTNNNDDDNKGRPVQLYNGFAEMSFGEFEGFAPHDPNIDKQERDRFRSIATQIKSNPTMKFPGKGGECTIDVQQRSTLALEQYLNDFPNDTHLAVVCHGRTNKVLIAATALQDVSKFPQVKQSNTCINVMDIDKDGKWTIQLLNYIEHVKDNVIVRPQDKLQP